MFSEFRKREKKRSTLFRTALLVPSPETLRFFDSGGVMSSRIASKTTLNWASYFFSRAASFRARSSLEASIRRKRTKLA
jgi:hypothetical protein